VARPSSFLRSAMRTRLASGSGCYARYTQRTKYGRGTIALNEMLDDPDPERAQRVMAAMLQMGKIDVEQLREAYEAA
jgi:hypothetical protein